jgi:hypothetical protein
LADLRDADCAPRRSVDRRYCEPKEAIMYVIAKHQIKDTEAFFAVARTAAEGAPPDVHGRQFCPKSRRR